MPEASPQTVDHATQAADATPAPEVSPAPGATQSPGATRAPAPPRDAPAAEFPGYTRSLLRIAVPVTVTLAEKRQPLGRVIELSPGSIIQFDKSCEEMLELSAAGRKIAAGEAVKVGDKFGLRITSIVLPDERFEPVRRRWGQSLNSD